MNPKVTVLMTTYNGERFLCEAVESILRQTFTDFEFLIVDDASADASCTIIESYSDPRIRLVRNETNLGQIRSLNKGLSMALGEYVARMDQDDLSAANRLERQVQFLNRHSNVGLLGTGHSVVDNEGRVLKTPFMEFNEPSIIAWRILWHNCMAPHSGTMMRREVVERVGRYDERFWYAADYDLWLRLNFETDLAKLPDNLVLWRSHQASTTATYGMEKQVGEIKAIVAAGFSRLLSRQVSNEMAWAARKVFSGKLPDGHIRLRELANLICDVYYAFARHRASRGDRDLNLAKSDILRMMCAIEIYRQTWTGKKDLSLLFNAWRVSPSNALHSTMFRRALLRGTTVHKIYNTLRHFAALSGRL